MGHEAVLVPGLGIGKRITSVATKVVDAVGVEMTYALCDEQWDAGKAQVPSYVAKACVTHEAVLKGPLVAHAPVSLDALLRREVGCACRAVEVAQPTGGKVLVAFGDDEGFGGLAVPKGSRAAQHLARDLGDASGLRMAQASAFDVMPTNRRGCEEAASCAARLALGRGAATLVVASDSRIQNDADALLVQAAQKAADEADGDLAVEVVPVGVVAARLAAGLFDHEMLLVPARMAAPMVALADGLAGGPGRTPCVAFGSDITVYGVDAAQVDPAAPDPTAMVLAAALMLESFGEGDAARRIRGAVSSAMTAGERVSLDDYADAVIARL